ncbi:MAG: 1-acyl-sn-glycerol-3-phosphate acyltransferase [Flavobacteriales bacterium]|nr:1-acyl-sn-glycerol-3-phosphate acyltransferase [Flavobacteriales bacterium]
MSKYDNIRPYYDSEVNAAICSIIDHPMLDAMMKFSFPLVPREEWKAQLKKITSIYEFQSQFIYQALSEVLAKSSDGLSTSGFEKLKKDTAYLYISNHRDIILDTSLLNVCLFDNSLVMTASAIGDNLVKNPFMYELAKLNRNFLVLRNLSPREMLLSSKIMSDYIKELITVDNRSVWIAQREGRTKDGNDATHQGVLKMLAMAADDESIVDYFKRVKIVPISMSYEIDPTDQLKIPELLANANNIDYVKSDNEDFNSVLSGIIGQKKRIHIHAGDPIDAELDKEVAIHDNQNKQLQALAKIIDKSIIGNFKLWPSNYVAHDIMNGSTAYSDQYSAKQKEMFINRMQHRLEGKDEQARSLFLGMYANPVENKKKLEK